MKDNLEAWLRLLLASPTNGKLNARRGASCEPVELYTEGCMRACIALHRGVSCEPVELYTEECDEGASCEPVELYTEECDAGASCEPVALIRLKLVCLCMMQTVALPSMLYMMEHALLSSCPLSGPLTLWTSKKNS